MVEKDNGGIHIHGDANIGGDFTGRDGVGRDQIGRDQIERERSKSDDPKDFAVEPKEFTRLDRIALALYGDTQSGFMGVVAEVRELNIRMERIEDRQIEIMARLDNSNVRRLGRFEQIVISVFSGLVTAIGLGSLWLSLY